MLLSSKKLSSLLATKVSKNPEETLSDENHVKINLLITAAYAMQSAQETRQIRDLFSESWAKEWHGRTQSQNAQ